MNTYTFKVRLGDTDIGGIVYYPNFYKWMDEATHEFLGAIGFPSSQLFTVKQLGIPLVEAKCNILHPLMFEDVVTIESEIQELGHKSFTIQHRFMKENQLIAEGFEIRVWVSFDEQIKALAIPEEIREKMMALKS